MNAYVSCICKGDVTASIVFVNGRSVATSVSDIVGGNDPSNQYSNTIKAYKKGLTLLRNVTERNKDVDEVIIESNNSAFVAWINRGYALPKYNDEFFDLMEALNNIPVKYTCVHSKEIKAKLYAKKSNIDRVRLSGVEDFLK